MSFDSESSACSSNVGSCCATLDSSRTSSVKRNNDFQPPSAIVSGGKSILGSSVLTNEMRLTPPT